MPFIPNTPESFLGRADSRNPSTTCRGICNNGKPCRRTVRLPQNHRTAFTPSDSADNEKPFCWQHQDQKPRQAKLSPGPCVSGYILETRTSLETIAERLGFGLEPTTPQAASPRVRSKHISTQGAPRKPRKTKSFLLCLCFQIPLEEANISAQRPRPRALVTLPIRQSASRAPSFGRLEKATSSVPRPEPKPLQTLPGSQTVSQVPSLQSRGVSLPSNVPPPVFENLDFRTAFRLTSEILKPFFPSEEPGFIYMFRMIPLVQTPLVGTFQKTIFLKVGRASNVQRRLNQWSRQCEYNVEILRFYPYIPSSSESTGVVPSMTPHCHRVERLIHIELAGRGLRADHEVCTTCNREHREWFEVEQSAKGIAQIDRIIRNWIEWDRSSAVR